MIKNKHLGIVIFIFIASFFVGGHKDVLAASRPNGITVSPAFQQVRVTADKTQQPVTFSITNDRSAPQTINLTTADFNTLNESGGLFFVGTNPTALQKKYGLAKWFSIPQNEITIQPRQTKVINANILNLPDMSGGGHYGALMIRIVGTGIEATGNNNVSIDPVASSLLFVTKIGGDTHKLSLTSVDFHHNLFKAPKSVKLKFKNTGNAHVVPRGIVKIVSSDGELISQGTINQNSDIILPESNRIYAIDMRQLASASSPGKYKLYVDFRIDGIDQPRGYQTSFLVIPFVWLSVTALLLVALIGGAVFGLRWIKVRQKR